MRLEINKISIEGFRGYKDKVVYDLGLNTVISADNGKGKTTIREAIAWAITGCDSEGNEKATTKLVNNNKPKVTEVCLWITLDEEKHTIIRRKKGSSNDVYYDEKKSSTSELSQEIFKNKNVFLSIFNPDYFPGLTPKDAKQLLTDVLKPIGRDDIFAELGDYLVKVLNDNEFMLPDTFMKDCRDEIKEHQDNVIYLEGVQDGLKEMEVKSKKEFTKEEELLSLKNELNELNNIESVEQKILKLEKPNDYAAELAELKVDETVAKSMLNNLSLQELIPVEHKKQLKENLLSEYHMKKAKLDNMETKIAKCDKCGNEIDLTAEAKKMLKDDIKDICNRGVHIKDEIKEIESKNIEIENKNREIKAAKEKEVNSILADISIKRQDLLNKAEESINNYENLVNKIKSENENNQATIQVRKSELLSKIRELEIEKQDIVNFNASVDSAIQHNKKLTEDREINAERIKNSKNKINQLNVALDACKQYNSIKLKKQSEQIKPYLDNVEITFEKLTKDGELKEDFKINYEGKEFNRLSNAEKIKAGLEVSNLLANICHMHVPVFVDNAESINNIPRFNDSQIIIAKVTTDDVVKVEVV